MIGMLQLLCVATRYTEDTTVSDYSLTGTLPPPGTGVASAAVSDFIATEIKENLGKSITNAAEELATQLVVAFDNEPEQTRFIPSDHQSRDPEKMNARGHSRA
jgi:hypothetical protein